MQSRTSNKSFQFTAYGFFSVWVCVFVLMTSGYGDDRLIQSDTLTLHRTYYIIISIILYKELLNTYNVGIICLSILV